MAGLGRNILLSFHYMLEHLKAFGTSTTDFL